MGRYSCKICDDKAACRAIDEELGKGGSAPFIARLMTYRGFSVSDTTIVEHRKHAVVVPPGIAKTRKDFALMVRDKAIELFERPEVVDPETGETISSGLSLANKDHAPGIAAGLKAQAEINKQANKSDDRKTSIAIAFILSGATSGGPPEHLLIADGNTIDGDFEEMDPDE